MFPTTRRATLTAALLLFACVATPAAGQPLSRYRNIALESDVAAVMAAADIPSAVIRTLHAQPALLQEFEWWPPHFLRGSVTEVDTVEHVIFSFYNGMLFRLVVDYDHLRTDGMRSEGLIEALSNVYGAVSAGDHAALPVLPESGERVAVWAEGDYSVQLYRSLYAFRLVLVSGRLEIAARSAEAQAVERGGNATFRP